MTNKMAAVMGHISTGFLCLSGKAHPRLPQMGRDGKSDARIRNLDAGEEDGSADREMLFEDEKCEEREAANGLGMTSLMTLLTNHLHALSFGALPINSL